ncbi:hypothetical protein K525DRAFT_266262 [Schizophyllum commune Loenen D]|nr:hypothetical protein K525DRAFT_266262 [Schizophyllum commune Loenen D]
MPPHALRRRQSPLALSALERLAVTSHETGGIALDFFESAHNVQRLSIDYHYMSSPLILPTAWKLTNLTIKCGEGAFGNVRASLGPCLQAIAACSPTLEYCHITAIGSNARHCGTEKPTTYPALKELILVGAAHLLTLITAPSLAGVRLDTTSVPRANSWNGLPAFEDMVVRSFGCPNLRVLTLTNVQQSVPNLIRCLRRLPSLTSLSITDSEGIGYPESHALVQEGLVRALTRSKWSKESLLLRTKLKNLSLFYHRARYDEEDEEELQYYDPDKYMRRAMNRMEGTRSRRIVGKGLVLEALEHFETDCRDFWDGELEKLED